MPSEIDDFFRRRFAELQQGLDQMQLVKQEAAQSHAAADNRSPACPEQTPSNRSEPLISRRPDTIALPAAFFDNSLLSSPVESPRIAFREINELSDADLAEIFERLSPRRRVIWRLWRKYASVRRRCLNVNRITWRDVIKLDLSLIPGENIAATIKQCPNLQIVFAQYKTFCHRELYVLARIPLLSVKLFRCCCIVDPDSGYAADAFSAAFSAEIRNARWHEMTLRDFGITVPDVDVSNIHVDFPASFPSSLKRLQLKDLRSSLENKRSWSETFFKGLEQLQQLEALILTSDCANGQRYPIWMAFHYQSTALCERIGALRNLRELGLGSFSGFAPDLRPIFNLPKLEILFLHNFRRRFLNPDSTAWLRRLFTMHSTLRILILTGDLDTMVELPIRRRYPNEADLKPPVLPLLHIFLSKAVAANIKFPTAFDSAEIHEIDGPLDQFLEREDIKPIFKGVWIVEKLREATKLGAGKLPEFHPNSTICAHERMKKKKLKCRFCPRLCPSQTRLLVHERCVHTKILPYGCCRCTKRCAGAFLLKQHVKFAHEAHIYPCRYCDARFNSVYYRSAHTKKQHYGVQLFKCALCSRALCNKEALRHHLHSLHYLSVGCCKCLRRFDAKIQLRSHLMHPNCSLALRQERLQRRNMKQAAAKQMKCPCCERISRNLFQFANHLTCIHGFKCDMCPLSFCFDRHRSEHIRACHPELTPHQPKCELCGVILESPDLTLHFDSCIGLSRTSVQPRRRFAPIELPAVHANFFHGCVHCGETFPDPVAKSVHIQRMHLAQQKRITAVIKLEPGIEATGVCKNSMVPAAKKLRQMVAAFKRINQQNCRNSQ